MKKLMIALAVVAMAAVANAANVKWTTAILYTPGADGTFTDTKAKAASMPTSVVMTFYTDAEMTSAVTLSGGSSADQLTTMSKLSATTEGYDFVYNTTYYYKAAYTATYGGKEWTMDASGSFLQNKSQGNATINVATGSKWTAAPEPTSGLLLLLGVAGLALKRKRA